MSGSFCQIQKSSNQSGVGSDNTIAIAVGVSLGAAFLGALIALTIFLVYKYRSHQYTTSVNAYLEQSYGSHEDRHGMTIGDN